MVTVRGSSNRLQEPLDPRRETPITLHSPQQEQKKKRRERERREEGKWERGISLSGALLQYISNFKIQY